MMLFKKVVAACLWFLAFVFGINIVYAWIAPSLGLADGAGWVFTLSVVLGLSAATVRVAKRSTGGDDTRATNHGPRRVLGVLLASAGVFFAVLLTTGIAGGVARAAASSENTEGIVIALGTLLAVTAFFTSLLLLSTRKAPSSPEISPQHLTMHAAAALEESASADGASHASLAPRRLSASAFWITASVGLILIVSLGAVRLLRNSKGDIDSDVTIRSTEAPDGAATSALPSAPLDRNDDDALAMGWRYREGDGVPQDYAKAAEYFEQSAGAGSPKAQFDLAILYYYGLVSADGDSVPTPDVSHTAAESDPADTIARARGDYEFSRKTLGEDDRKTLAMLNSLAVALCRDGRFDEAIECFGQVIEGRRELLGDDHPDTLWSIGRLARALVAQGMMDDAEELYLEVLRGRYRTVGEDDPATLDVIAEIGYFYLLQGRKDEAIGFIPRALDARRRIMGDTHPSTLQSMNEMSALCWATGFDDTDARCAEALRASRVALDPDDPITLMACVHMALRNQSMAERALTQFIIDEHFDEQPDHLRSLRDEQVRHEQEAKRLFLEVARLADTDTRTASLMRMLAISVLRKEGWLDGTAEVDEWTIWLDAELNGAELPDWRRARFLEFDEQPEPMRVSQSITKARELFKLAAAQEYAPAVTMLGTIAAHQDSDTDKALQLWQQAVQLGDPWAEYLLGSAHLSLVGSADSDADRPTIQQSRESHLTEALFWLEAARQDGVEPIGGLIQHVWAIVPDEAVERVTAEVFRRLDEDVQP